METIEQKLDALAEYHSQKDSIDAQKRALKEGDPSITLRRV